MNFYTPTQDGVSGLEDFGDVGHGTNYHDWSPVYVDGKLVVGRCTQPELVSQYFARGGKVTKCPGPVWAKGALRFFAGWDTPVTERIYE